MENKVLRIIDANYNRAREGLRVIEDILRFFYHKPDYARHLKKLRHELANIITKLSYQDLLEERDVKADSLRKKEYNIKVNSPLELLRLNFQRVAESLRVLEEVMRLFHPYRKKEFCQLRFKLYELEQKVVLSLQ